jgi:prepilin-type processing-associated H-X9-DG protein
VKEFLNTAFADGHCVAKCPCIICWDYRFLTQDKVQIHLCQEGFMLNYLVWCDHGEAEELPIESAGNETRTV